MRILNNWLESYLIFTDNSEPSVLFKHWSGVSVIAAALERKCFLEWDALIYPNMYIVLIGPSGCRKGTAMAPALALLRDLGIYISADSITREAFIRKMAEARSDTVIDDRVTTHCSITIFSPELMVFIGDGRDKIVADLADWFDCRDPWTYFTKNKGEDCINGVWVNMIGGTTPSLLGDSLARTAIGGGLTSRIIFVYADRKGKSVLLPILTKEEKALREELLRDLEAINILDGQFNITEGWLERYAAWYPTCEDNCLAEGPNLEPYLTRRSVHLRKMTMIFSASRSDDMMLTGDDFDSALNLLSKTERLMPYAFRKVGRQECMAFLQDVRAFIAYKDEGASEKDLVKRFHMELSEMELTAVLKTLIAQGEIKREKKQFIFVGSD